jgi:phosphohistidine phosphatase
VRLLIVRHGPSESRDPVRWPSDDHRPLSREGRRETREAAAGIASLEREVRAVVTSPAIRARATAEIVRDRLGIRSKLTSWGELAPGTPAVRALDRLAGEAGARLTLVLVGHEPQLGELVGLALTGEAVSVTRLGRAGVAAVAFPKAVRPGAGVLEWRLDRKALARLGRTRGP